MKSFFVKITVFVVVVILVDFMLGLILDTLQQKSFENNPLRFEVRTMYAIEKGNSDVDIIGASEVSHSYIPQMIADSLGMTVYNYGKDGCFFVYQNCLINLMLEHHNPKVILWSVGKDCLSINIRKEVTDWQSINDFYSYYGKNNYCRWFINSRSKYQKFFMLSGLYRHNSQLLSLFEPFLTSESIDDRTKGYIPLPDEGYRYPEYIDMAITHDTIDTWKVDLLRNTLTQCQSKGVIVIFCFSPNYKDEHVEATSQWRELKKVAEEYDVPMIDFEHHVQFKADSTLFKDNAHLNDRGARLYMEYFIPQLKQTLAK